ncbi:hypothetical protein [Endozoicomonas montiporae]|uniref:Uncharacterized protein n=1 Tax=Endozoicomonas montiporae CL-33 TaxID=570277 RepID=A0A142B7R1_9GAMM|nr:hypothetical protein [Endozoicomonas montiporae]AMO54787.1 hypothetical protein EZMO1_0540 [Endozoicomonas montiporae CL-33]
MRYFFSLIKAMLHINLGQTLKANELPDPGHFSRRRLTRQYKAKKALVRNVWIAACSLMLINPVLPVALIIALPTTLLSFMILDETS